MFYMLIYNVILRERKAVLEKKKDILRIYSVMMMMMMSRWLGSFILMYLMWSLRGSTAERRVNVTFTLSNDAHALSAPAPPVAAAEAVVRNVSVVFSVA